MKYTELKKLLRGIGCTKVSEGGNHEIWLSPITKKKFVVGRHNSQEVASGTLAKIKKLSGL